MAIARLLLKHRGAASLPGAVDIDVPEDDSSSEDAKELAAELVRMGPTFIKLGQLLSTRADVLPPAYLRALSSLREEVEPLPAGEAQRVVEDELGTRVSTLFSSFDAEPFASASLGQVHRAALRDGRPVAVKVQRPGARGRALEDMEVISELAAFVDEHSGAAARFGLVDMVEEFRTSLVGELDYRREAANLCLMRSQLSRFRRMFVPEPVDDYTTARVLTMDLVEGRSVSALGPLARTEVDCSELAEELVGSYLDQVLVHGFFHADPHPGNLLLTSDGRLALVDLGMVARISPDTREQLLRLLLAISSGDGTSAAEALEHLGKRLDGYDPDRLKSRVAGIVLGYTRATVGDLEAGRVLSELAMACSACGLRPSPELTLLAKALLNLDEVARTLEPDVRLDAVIEAHAAHVMRHRMMEAISPAHVMRAVLDSVAFMESIPRRLTTILEAVSEGRLTISLEGLDEPAILRGAQKLANRVATGVLIAAFVLAAALFSSERSGAFVWGYPILTVVFLGLAVVVAAWLAIGIVRGDVRRRDKST